MNLIPFNKPWQSIYVVARAKGIPTNILETNIYIEIF